MTPGILIIDNYDSFTYNLLQRIGELGHSVEVWRNDAFSISDVETLNPYRIIISPGPCGPNEAGRSLEIIKHFAGRIPILGVCLGHQCIGQAFGAKVERAPRVMHGKTSLIVHDNLSIYRGVENPFPAARYHSLIVPEESLPECLLATAHTQDQHELMGIRHRDFPVEGVQFHPESFMTPAGYRLLENFLSENFAKNRLVGEIQK